MQVDDVAGGPSRRIADKAAGLQTLPYITVQVCDRCSMERFHSHTLRTDTTQQHDALAVIQDVIDGTVSSEAFWISVYRQGRPTVHGKVMVRCSLDEDDHGRSEADFEAMDGITFEHQSSTSFLVSCPSLDVPATTVRLPKQVVNDVLASGVDCMDISPDGKLCVVGGRDGKLKVISVRGDTSSPVTLAGHVGDILSCHFFPSSQVVLSTSSDLSIRIFSALDGSNPRTLTGHTAAVTDAVMVARGRHIVTSSNDGTVRLWSVSDSKNIKTWSKLAQDGPLQVRRRVTKLAILSTTWSSEGHAGSSAQPSSQGMEDAAFTGRHAVVAGLEDGTISVIDLSATSSSPPLINAQAGSSRRAVSALSSRRTTTTKSDDTFVIAAGTVDGEVVVYTCSTAFSDLSELCRFKRNSADITALAFPQDSSQRKDTLITILVATSDGLPYLASIDAASGKVDISAEYAGFNIDSADSAIHSHDSVFIAGKDGSLKRY